MQTDDNLGIFVKKCKNTNKLNKLKVWFEKLGLKKR